MGFTVILAAFILIALIYAIVLMIRGAQQKNGKKVTLIILATLAFLALVYYILVSFITTI